MGVGEEEVVEVEAPGGAPEVDAEALVLALEAVARLPRPRRSETDSDHCSNRSVTLHRKF